MKRTVVTTVALVSFGVVGQHAVGLDIPVRQADSALKEISPDGEQLYEIYFGDSVSESSTVVAYELDLEIKTQELVADCMERYGFEHDPLSSAEIADELLVDESNDLETREEYGFEISMSEPETPVLKGDDNVPGSEAFDALYGPKGCYVEADQPLSEFEAIAAEYFDSFQTMWVRYDEDSRTQSAERTWRECMQEDGFDVVDTEEAEEVVTERLDEAATEDLAEVQEFEIDVAVSVYECDQSVRPVRAEVVAELSAEFDKQYHDEIVRRFVEAGAEG